MQINSYLENIVFPNSSFFIDKFWGSWTKLSFDQSYQ